MMNIVAVWQLWIVAVAVSFGAIEGYAAYTKQLTLSQAVWGYQDMFPLSTWLLTIVLLGLLIHFTNYRLVAPFVWVFNKVVG